VEFRRINGLPPYVFSIINQLRDEGRQSGSDVIDMGFGNPDIPSPDLAVEKLAEAARNPRNHRYSASRGIPKLRMAAAALYKRRFDVDVDPDTEVVTTIGAKEGLSHLMWTLVGPGDTALVPTPSYPIHIYAPLFAGADVQQVRLGPDQDFFANLMESWESTWPRPRVIVFSFPHNPTTEVVDLAWMARLVAFAKEHEVLLVHDFAYSETYYDGFKPPSILEVPGAKDVAVELYTLTKSFSMAGWRVAFTVGNAEMVAALTKLKSYLDYGTSRRNALVEGLNRIGWEMEPPKGTMFAWAPIPEPYQEMGSLEFSKYLVTDAEVATSPGVGFGRGGEGFVRFALIENEQRIGQAIRNLRRTLTKLG